MLLVQDCVTAYYSHPWAWDEIGFGGPAYPRAYMRLEAGRGGAVGMRRSSAMTGSAPEVGVGSIYSRSAARTSIAADPQGGTH